MDSKMKNKPEPIWTKESIAREIYQFMDVDPVYALTLIPLALQKDLITPDEATKAKKDLDGYYQEIARQTEEIKATKNKRMMEVFKVVGYSPTKVLWQIIDQFPKRCAGNPNRFELKINHEGIMKKTKIRSLDYYGYLAKLQDHDYIQKVDKNIYSINFPLLTQVIQIKTE